MTKTHDFLLRIPEDLWAELQEAKWTNRMDYTEILLQGLFIRLRAVAPDKVPGLLKRLDYQRELHPGLPRKASAESNGQGPPAAPAGILPGPDNAPDDGWGLDGDASDA